MKFLSIEKCSFLREELHEEDSPKIVQEGFFFKTTTKVVTMVKEYFWNFELLSELKSCVKGGGLEECTTLVSYEKSQTLKTFTTLWNLAQIGIKQSASIFTAKNIINKFVKTLQV